MYVKHMCSLKDSKQKPCVPCPSVCWHFAWLWPLQNESSVRVILWLIAFHALSYFWDSSRLVQVAVHFLISVEFIEWLNHNSFIHSMISELWGCFSLRLLEIMYCEYTWIYMNPGTEMRVFLRLIRGLCRHCLRAESSFSFSEMVFVACRFPLAQCQDN